MTKVGGAKRGKTSFQKRAQKICNDKREMKTLGEEGECISENNIRRTKQSRSRRLKECGGILPAGYAKYSSGYILGNSQTGKKKTVGV